MSVEWKTKSERERCALNHTGESKGLQNAFNTAQFSSSWPTTLVRVTVQSNESSDGVFLFIIFLNTKSTNY